VSLAAISMAGLSLTGCNILGPAYYMVSGPEETKAVHTLEPTRPTVVFVDDRDNRLPRRTLRFVVAESATKVMLENDVLTKTATGDIAAIDGRAAITAATRDRFGEPLSVAAIGNACSADVVVHVVFEAFTLTADGTTFAPSARLRVKVIDAVNQRRLFPPGENVVGVPIDVVLKQRPADLPNSNSGMLQAQELLAKECGRAVAELFFDHVPLSSDRARN
jgi:hypothetical protein